MTILEMNIYNTLLAVEAEKAERNIEPIHSLLIQDRLQERVEERIGQPITHTEFYLAHQKDSKAHIMATVALVRVQVAQSPNGRWSASHHYFCSDASGGALPVFLNRNEGYKTKADAINE